MTGGRTDYCTSATASQPDPHGPPNNALQRER